MDECMHSFNVNMHDANVIVKNLIPNTSNKSQLSLIQERLQETHSLNEHMTWTNDPKPDPKRKPTVHLD